MQLSIRFFWQVMLEEKLFCFTKICFHRCTLVGNPGGGGVLGFLGFWLYSFDGVLKVVRKSRGPPLLHFYDQIFWTLHPTSPPWCVHLSLFLIKKLIQSDKKKASYNLYFIFIFCKKKFFVKVFFSWMNVIFISVLSKWSVCFNF